MSLLKGIFLGIVQGLAEFLPVSSSGHLKLFQHLFDIKEDNLFITVMLHLGTLVAVFIVYHKLIGKMILEFFRSIGDICTGKFKFSQMNKERRMMVMIVISTALLGIMIIPFGEHSLKDYIEMLNDCESIIPLGFAFLVTGLLLLITFWISKKSDRRRPQAKVGDALIIGASQCVATISGISRSGSTVAAGLLCGLDREYMVQYSFILSIPAILAAAASDAKSAFAGEVSVEAIPLIGGIIAALISGVAAIKLIEWLIKKDRYNIFGYYCGALGILVIILGICGV